MIKSEVTHTKYNLYIIENLCDNSYSAVIGARSYGMFYVFLYGDGIEITQSSAYLSPGENLRTAFYKGYRVYSIHGSYSD